MKQFLLYTFFGVLLTGTMADAAVSISEIRIDQTGSDDDEFIEFFSTSTSESLDSHFLIILGDGAGGSGWVEEVLDLSGHATSLNRFVVAESTFTLGTADITANLNFENSDNVTYLLVKDFTGALDDDLDGDDDGGLDSTPWSSVVDGISLIEKVGEGDLTYASGLGLPSIGPDGDFAPGHVYREGDTGPWRIGVFDPLGVTDTPGAPNPIPEPVSGFLALIGGALCYFRRRRRS